MFGFRGFDHATYRVKFLHTRPAQRVWPKYAAVFAVGAVIAIAFARPEVRGAAGVAISAINETASAIASAIPEMPAQQARVPAPTIRTTANAPRIDAVERADPAPANVAPVTAATPRTIQSESARAEAIKTETVKREAAKTEPAKTEPARSEPAREIAQPATAKPAEVARAVPAASPAPAVRDEAADASARAPSAAPPPRDDAAVTAIPLPPERAATRNVSRDAKRKRYATDEAGETYIHLYDRTLPNGRREPVYQRVGRHGLHDDDGWRARAYAAPIEQRRRPFFLFD